MFDLPVNGAERLESRFRDGEPTGYVLGRADNSGLFDRLLLNAAQFRDIESVVRIDIRRTDRSG